MLLLQIPLENTWPRLARMKLPLHVDSDDKLTWLNTVLGGARVAADQAQQEQLLGLVRVELALRRAR
jgi:hypothetical protein